MGDDEAANLLQQTLDEEGEADKKLTDLAESVINVEADHRVAKNGNSKSQAKAMSHR